LREAITGSEDAEYMETMLKVLSHSAKTKRVSPNCTKERDMLTIPLTLMLMIRPTADAGTKHTILVGDAKKLLVETAVPLKTRRQVEIETKLWYVVSNETFTACEARANVGEI
jgi:hypothetical protein